MHINIILTLISQILREAKVSWWFKTDSLCSAKNKAIFHNKFSKLFSLVFFFYLKKYTKRHIYLFFVCSGVLNIYTQVLQPCYDYKTPGYKSVSSFQGH
jgi:uncharacterized protein YPO0396